MITTKTSAFAAGAATALLFIAATAAIFSQGGLDPTGAPSPTMKTLNQVEARIALPPAGFDPDTDFPIRIDTAMYPAGASFYLTEDLEVAASAAGSPSGILIDASNVTIDLNGFALIGASNGSGAGVRVIEQGGSDAFLDNLTVRNGTIRGWGEQGVDAAFGRNGLFHSLHLHDNGTAEDNDRSLGVGLITGPDSIVRECTASENFTDGIRATGNSTISDSTAYSNNRDGFRVSDGSLIRDSTSATNGDDGIKMTGGSFVTRCVSRDNREVGIHVIGNTGAVTENLIVDNGEHGILCPGDRNRIESNHIFFDGSGVIGIAASGTSNLFFRNTASGSVTGFAYDISSTNIFTRVTLAGGSVPDSTNSWENLAN